MSAPAEAGVPTAEGGEAPRRERRPRNDNRRRSSETENSDVGATGLNDAAATDAAVKTTAELPAEADGENGAVRAPRERRSRDRYGRDRRERAGRDPAAAPADEETASAEASLDQPNPLSEDATQETPARSSYFSQPASPVAMSSEAAAPAQAPTQGVQALTTETPAAVAEGRPAPVLAAPVAAVAAPAQAAPRATAPVAPVAPVAATPLAKGLPKVQAYTLSIDAMNEVAQTSGLQWVNSDAAKVAQVQAAIAAEPKPVHVPREPQPVVLPDNGPLVLVETRKDLRNMPLPFEAQ